MQSFQHAREAQQSQGTSLAVAPKHHSPAKNRGRMDVMADVLDCCRSPSSKSHIMLHANLNSIVATRMVQSLTETGLLDSVHDDGSVVYLATPKGTGFVAKYVELQHLISPGLVPIESKMNNPNRLNTLSF
jgi:predicted transcriptional regulator